MDILAQLLKTRIFAGVSAAAITELIQSGQEILLENEQVLFRQGDVADSFYIVLDGRVLAMLEGHETSRVVTDILPGEVIGEVTLLSDLTRSMTVMSVVPTRLLKISKETMTQFCLKNPQTLINMMNVLAHRSTQSLKLLSVTKSNRYVSLVNLASGKYGDEAEKLIQSLASGDDVLIKHPSTTTAAISHYPEFLKYLSYELGYEKEIFHVLDLNQSFFSRCFIENATHEVVFVPANADVNILNHYNRLTDIKKLKKHVKRSLVLLHDADVKMPKNTLRWLQAGKFSAHYHVRLGHAEDQARLRRFLLGIANGVVISGGGARSLVGVGAIKAIVEKNIPIDALGGTSMGAVITGLLLLSDDLKTHDTYCRRITHALKSWNKFRSLTWPLISIYSSASGTREIQKICGDIRAEDLWKPFFSIACSYSDSSEYAHQQGLLWEILRASSSLPALVPPCVIDGKIFVDGGIANNFPTDVMRNVIGPNGILIGVNSIRREHAKKYKFPPIMPFFETLLVKLGWRHRDYVLPRLYDLMENTILFTSTQRELANTQLANIIIAPDLRQYHLSDFAYYDKFSEMGYQEAIRTLNAYLAKK